MSLSLSLTIFAPDVAKQTNNIIPFVAFVFILPPKKGIKFKMRKTQRRRRHHLKKSNFDECNRPTESFNRRGVYVRNFLREKVGIWLLLLLLIYFKKK